MSATVKGENRSTPSQDTYVAPTVIELGTLHELTLNCDKSYGQSDGFTFQGQSIVCASR